MGPSEIRRLKLVSKDMKCLIESGGQYLTQQYFINYLFIYEVSFDILITIRGDEYMNTSECVRNFACCSFSSIWLQNMDFTLKSCDRLKFLQEGNITCTKLSLYRCEFSEKDKLVTIPRLLNYTGAKELIIYGHESRMENEIFSLPAIRELTYLAVQGPCDFFDEDLITGNYTKIHLSKCFISERMLKRILEETVEGNGRFETCAFGFRDAIDVNRLLDGIPNLEKHEQHYILRNARDQQWILLISATRFSMISRH